MKAEAFSPDMLEFLDQLSRHGVRYLLIGGYAVHFHGHCRFTADIDFAFPPDGDNAERMFGALRDFWGGDVPHVRSAEELLQPGLILQFGVKPNRIDLLNRVDGIDLDASWERRIEERIEGSGIPLSIISLPDLRASKRAANRLKDQDDLLNLPVPPEADPS